MNRRPPGLSLCEAIEGFTKYKVVEGLSERTLDSYMGHLAKLVEPCYAIIMITGSWAGENRDLVSGNSNRMKITAQ